MYNGIAIKKKASYINLLIYACDQLGINPYEGPPCLKKVNSQYTFFKKYKNEEYEVLKPIIDIIFNLVASVCSFYNYYGNVYLDPIFLETFHETFKNYPQYPDRENILDIISKWTFSVESNYCSTIEHICEILELNPFDKIMDRDEWQKHCKRERIYGSYDMDVLVELSNIDPSLTFIKDFADTIPHRITFCCSVGNFFLDLAKELKKLGGKNIYIVMDL